MTTDLVRRNRDPMERIRAGSIDTESGCHEWQGGVRSSGYGRIRAYGITRSIHVIAWEAMHGPVPPGKILMHSCDNRRCWNIEHLSVGTHALNAQDRDQKGRGACGERNSKAKLTAADVIEIRSIYAMRPNASALARRFGVNHGAILGIVKGQTWRHL